MTTKTTNIEGVENRLTDLRADTKKLIQEIEADTPPTTQPPRIVLAFMMGLSVGVSLGAVATAIALGLWS